MPRRFRQPSHALFTFAGDESIASSGKRKPNLVAITRPSRLPRIARPNSSSFTKGPYTSAVSKKVMPSSIARAIELGITFFDTAEVYGPFVNEELFGRAIRGKRDGLVIATKFGFRFPELAIDSSPANVKRACDDCLKRLGIETIDLFYQHRVDPKTPIEDAVGAVADLIRAGKAVS